MKSISFWDIRNSACHLLACWFLAERISSSLKTEQKYSSETSVDAQRTTRRYIPAEFCLPPACLLVSWKKSILSTLKMEAKCSSERSVDDQRTTQRYIPEVDTLYDTIVAAILS
jgi:hypothetical protein